MGGGVALLAGVVTILRLITYGFPDMLALRQFELFDPTIYGSSLVLSSLGDLLIHEGPALEAQRSAARIFGAERTYFVLNGTSTSNKIVNNALLRKDDIVLFDRNNHKSNHHGALFMADAIPVFL